MLTHREASVDHFPVILEWLSNVEEQDSLEKDA
jgi:hypothetical protein